MYFISIDSQYAYPEMTWHALRELFNKMASGRGTSIIKHTQNYQNNM